MVESKYFRNVSIASKWFCDYSAISGVRRLSARIQNDTEGTMKLTRLMAYVLLSFILSAVGWAQFGSSVQGTVRDASGAAISTAKVQLRDLGTGVVSQITTTPTAKASRMASTGILISRQNSPAMRFHGWIGALPRSTPGVPHRPPR